MSRKSTYALFDPTESRNEGSGGGITCIRTGAGLAYLGFATAELAREATERLGLGERLRIVELSQVLAHPHIGPRIERAVRIPDSATLLEYLRDPHVFAGERYLEDQPVGAWTRFRDWLWRLQRG